MIIRRFKKEDAKEVFELVFKTFNEFVAPDFEKQGIKKFLNEQTQEKQTERSKTRDIYVAIINKKIIGMIEGNGKDKVTRLFVNKTYHGKGIATCFMTKIENLYKKKSNKIKVFSSIYAIEFYRKMGYKKTTGIMRKKGFVYQPMKKVLR